MLFNSIGKYLNNTSDFNLTSISESNYLSSHANHFNFDLHVVIGDMNNNEKLNFLNSFDHIIFDTEYSFFSFDRNLLKYLKIPKTTVLVHDEFWKKRPFILRKVLGYSISEVFNFDKYAKMNLIILKNLIFTPCISLRQKLGRIKMVFFYSSKFTSELKERLKSFRYVDQICVLGERTQKNTQKIFRRLNLKSKIIFNPFIHEIGGVAEIAEKEDYKEDYIVAFSRIAREKNIEWIIKSFNNYNITYKDSLKLKIVGRVYEEDYLIELMNYINHLDLNNKVNWYLDKDDKVVKKILINSKTFICADLCDFNISTANAIYYGVPVVIMPTNSFPKMDDLLGVFSKNYSMKDFVESLNRSIRVNSRQIMVNNRNVFFKNSIKEYIEKIINGY